MSGILSYPNSWSVGPQPLADAFTGEPNRDYARFSSPWASQNKVAGQLNMQQMFDFGEMLWKYDPTYQQAVKRVIGYFITDIEFYDPTGEAKLKTEDINSYQEILRTQFRIKMVLRAALEEICVYGNALLSILPPIRRYLACPYCGQIHPASLLLSPENKKIFALRYHAKGVKFEATCAQCGRRGVWIIRDIKADYRRQATIQLWHPREFLLHYDSFTNHRIYTWRIPARIKKRVQDGDMLLLASMPRSMLEAIGEEKDYQFRDGMIFHVQEPTLSGFQTGGWGLPPSIFSYGPSRYVFGLRKMNETLAADYMIPIRIFSPARQGYSAGDGKTFDTAWSQDMQSWNAQVKRIIAEHRRDPASIHTIAQPIEYQILGGEGKSLVPGELLIQGEDMQLNANGIPPEFYRGNLTVQAAPMSARLFEAHWQQIPESCNRILEWTVSAVTPELGWKVCGVRLQPPKIADNMEHLMLLMQLLDRGRVADGTILRKVGLEGSEEKRRQLDEAMEYAELEAKQQKELDKLMAGNTQLQQMVDQQRMAADPAMQQQAGGAAPAGGAAGGAVPPPADPLAQIMAKIEQFGSPATPITPQDQLAIAQEAAAILANMPEITKRQKLREIEQINPNMKKLITSEMTEFHKSQNQQFIAQGQQMMQQGGGGMPM
jgi:hypothetical protein